MFSYYLSNTTSTIYRFNNNRVYDKDYSKTRLIFENDSHNDNELENETDNINEEAEDLLTYTKRGDGEYAKFVKNADENGEKLKNVSLNSLKYYNKTTQKMGFRGFFKQNVVFPNSNNLNDLYRCIINYVSSEGIESDFWVRLSFRQNNGRVLIENRPISIKDIEYYSSFKRVVEEYQNGMNPYGSDEDSNIGGYIVRYDFAQIVYVKDHGEDKFLFTNVEEVENPTKIHCVYNSLMGYVTKYCNDDVVKNLMKELKRDSRMIENYGSQLEKMNIKVITYRDCLGKIPAFRTQTKFIKEADKINYVTIALNKYLRFKITEPTIYYQNNVENPLFTINLVRTEGHCAIFKGYKDQYYYKNHKGAIYEMIEKDNRFVLDYVIGRSQAYERANGKATKLIIGYDLETVFDELDENCLKSYSLTYYIINREKGTRKKLGCISDLTEFLVVSKFLDVLEALNIKDEIPILLGFNSNSFDDFQLLSEMKKRDILDDVIYIPRQGKIYDISFNNCGTIFDLARYFPGKSLSAICEGLKLKHSKKSKPDFAGIQLSYMNKQLPHYFHNEKCRNVNYHIEFDYDMEDYEILEQKIIDNSKCKCTQNLNMLTYNLYDTLATVEAFFVIEELLNPILFKTMSYQVELYTVKTIAGFIYKLFEKGDCYENLPKMGKGDKEDKMTFIDGKEVKTKNYISYSEFKYINEAIFAGRVQCFKNNNNKNFFKDFNFNKKYCLIDIKSQYPYVCLNRWYGSGSITSEIGLEQCLKLEKIGFYCVSFDQLHLDKTIIPITNSEGIYDYNYKGYQKDVWLNTVDINCLIRNGCDVTSSEGFCFTEKVHGSKLFECLLPFKEMKEYEDNLKKMNLPWSAVRREMAKIFLNSLTGKVISKLYTRKANYVTKKDNMESIKSVAEDIGTIYPSHIINDFVGIVEYDIPSINAYEKYNKPAYLGTLIYSYAREHLYENIIKKYEVFYGDTDSCIILYEDFEKLKNKKLWEGEDVKSSKNTKWQKFMNNNFNYLCIEEKNVIGNQFGQFELEEMIGDDGKKYTTFNGIATIQAKNYFLLNKENNGEIVIVKSRFKGINMSRDKILTNLKLHNEELKQNTKCPEYFKYNNKEDNIQINPQETGYNSLIMYEFILSQNIIGKRNNILDFINQLYNNGYAYIMTSHINKSKNKTGESTLLGKIQNINLQQVYSIQKRNTKVYEKYNNIEKESRINYRNFKAYFNKKINKPIIKRRIKLIEEMKKMFIDYICD